MRIDKPLIEARLLRRYKRFLADVELADGGVVTVHCPNPGRLIGCQAPGSRVILRDEDGAGRKLRYTWQTIEVDGTWVNVDTSLPNRVVLEAVRAGQIRSLCGYDDARPEAVVGPGTRLDLLLTRGVGGAERCFVEVKTTTLARGRTTLFPDAKTARGTKHLRELARLARAGDRAVQLFLAGRGDVRRFRPADDVDPEYGAALCSAAADGVEILAFAAHVEPDELTLGPRLALWTSLARR